MAERPILKSEREAKSERETVKQAKTDSTPKKNVPRPVKKGDRKETTESSGEQRDATQGHWTDDMDGRSKSDRKGAKGKGRGKGRDARKAPVNPALMRGPRPSAKVDEPETQAIATEDTAAEVSAELSTDAGADTGADTVSASAETTTEAAPTTEETAADTAAPVEAAANESSEA